ncbi:MAG: hypothetical protein ABFD62_16765 [Syntrophaceae bacterium]
MYFSRPQKSVINRVFSRAENLVGGYYRLSPGQMKAHQYDVRTLAKLEKHEVSDNAFAHLCKYEIGPEGKSTGAGFYRICLQDNRILEAVERGTPFIRFPSLMTYIAVHELVHVVRFNNGESDFDLSRSEREIEEEKVHRITRNVLQGVSNPGFGLVLDCFSSRYKIN